MSPHFTTRPEPVRLMAGALVAGALIAGGCSSSQNTGSLRETQELIPIDFNAIEGWDADRLSEAIPPFIASCERWERLPDIHRIGYDTKAGTVADWLPACRAAKAVPAGDDSRARYFFETYFIPYRIRIRTAFVGQVTGYYEASLNGSWEKGGPFTVPVLSRPDDLIIADLGLWNQDLDGEKIVGRRQGRDFVPYPTRAEIEDGALDGMQYPILYVDDPIDAFVLHIQGSGRVSMEEGGVVRLGYSGRNGHPYYAIGRELIKRDILAADQVTMPAIRTWLADNTLEGREVMRLNQSYIFFRILNGPGPIGAFGAVLTPERSIAIDPSFVPLGAPVFISFPHPAGEPARVAKLTMAQDTGSAIRGPLRADFFWGYGDRAGVLAGELNALGLQVLLLPQTLGRLSPWSGTE